MKLGFLKVNDEWKTSRSDGTKCCFAFSTYDKVDEFINELSKRIGTKVTKDSFIGFKTIYVLVEKYEEAVIQGLDIILNDTSYEQAGFYWVNCYNMRSCWGYVQILQMAVHKDKLKDHCDWKESTKIEIEKWNEKLKSVLGTEVIVKEHKGYAQFFIKRTSTSHLEHENTLNKIRSSALFEESPFIAYALINYYGEFIKL